MLSLIACLLSAQATLDAPRLKTLCPNGAVVLVERMPREQTISVQLWASARSVPETPETHGFRHLLEHLLVKGPSKDVDKKLELKGCFLRARTFRDAMQIEISVGPRQLDLAIDTLKELLHPIEVTQEEIDHELSVMKEEFAIYDDAARLSSAAWDQAYGSAGIDPFGDLEAMKKATPQAIRDIQRKHFYPENLALVIAGPIDIDQATKIATEFVGGKQGAVKVPDEKGPDGKPGRIETEGFGEGRAAIVGGFDNPKTAASLAASLAVASDVEGSFVTYTPSAQRGLVIVGQTERTAGIGLRVDELKEGDYPRLFEIGRYLARSWVERQLQTSEGVAYIRGLLLCQGSGFRPEQMLDAVKQMTYDQFVAGLHSLAKDRAVTVVGR